MSGFGRRALSAVVALTLSAYPLVADTNAAMIKTSGAVTVNGKAVSESSALLSGDNVATLENGTAVISNTGTIVNVIQKSTITYKEKAIEVNSGTVSFSTNSAFSALVNGYTATASTETAKYLVVKDGRCAYLKVEQGTVVAVNGKDRHVVKQGGEFDMGHCEKAALVPPAHSGLGAYGAALVTGGASTVIVTTTTRNDASPSAP